MLEMLGCDLSPTGISWTRLATADCDGHEQLHDMRQFSGSSALITGQGTHKPSDSHAAAASIRRSTNDEKADLGDWPGWLLLASMTRGRNGASGVDVQLGTVVRCSPLNQITTE